LSKCFVYERDSELSNKQLEFYTLKCEKIGYTYKDYQNYKFRIYSLEDFPEIIKIIYFEGNSIYSGLIRINPKRNNYSDEPVKKVKVGFDFGTSHTTIVYKSNDMTESEQLLISEASPIILTDNDELKLINNDYLPVKFLSSKPISEKEFNEQQPWYPLLSMWKKFDLNEQKSILIDGIATFLPIIDKNHLKNVEKGLKWGLGGSTQNEYRNHYLNFLLTLILIELESRGYNSVEIFWSYPKAFSESEFQDITRFWVNENIIKKRNS